MKRRKPKPNTKPAEPANSHTAEVPQREAEELATTTGDPSSRMKAFLSCFLVFHMMALMVTFAAVIEPSDLQSALHEKLSFYVQNANFSTEDRSVYLASGSSSEQPFRFQTTIVDPHLDASILNSDVNDDRWNTVEPGGPAGGLNNDWYSRWLRNAAILAEAESSGAVAELLLPKVPQDQSIKAIRIIRLPTELTTAEDDDRPAPYIAFVSQRDGKVALVQAVEPRLATQKRGMEDG